MSQPPTSAASVPDDPNSPRLFALWMKGVQLKDYIMRRVLSTPLPKAEIEAPASQVEPGPLDRLFQQTSKTPQQKLVDQHENQVVDQILFELTSGDLPALGRLKLDDKKISDPIRIQERFWIDASFYYGYGAASDGDLFFDQIKVYPEGLEVVSPVERPSKASPSSVAVGATIMPSARGGRQNIRDRIKKKAVELWRDDPKFRKLKNRTEQAREVKAAVLGPEARDSDDMPECKLASAIRWVGQALKLPAESDGPA